MLALKYLGGAALAAMLAGNAYGEGAESFERFYVRPGAAEYGVEDGKTYETAFDDWVDVSWNASNGTVGSVDPGDTLVVCSGSGYVSGFGESNGTALVEVNGTNTRPITITGLCPQEAVIRGTTTSCHYGVDEDCIIPRAKLVANVGAVSALVLDDVDYINVSHLELYSLPGHAITNSLLRVYQSTGVLTTEDVDAVRNIVIEDMVIHDSNVLTDATVQCVRLIGSNIELKNSHIYNCDDDGVYIEGDSVHLSSLYIHDVNVREDGQKTGDCIQWGAGDGDRYAHNDSIADKIYCNFGVNEAKQAVILNCETNADPDPSVGNKITNSVLIGSQNGICTGECTGTVEVSGNLLFDRQGQDKFLCISHGSGGLSVPVLVDAFNNTFVTRYSGTPKTGNPIEQVEVDSALTEGGEVRLWNNLHINFTEPVSDGTAGRSLYAFIFNNEGGQPLDIFSISNSIFLDAGRLMGHAIECVTGSTCSLDHNLFWGISILWGGIAAAGTGDIIADPQITNLQELREPPPPGDFWEHGGDPRGNWGPKYAPTSPIWRAGRSIVGPGAKDARGCPRDSPPSLGPYVSCDPGPTP